MIKKKKKLIYEYISITFIIGVILLISFVLIKNILNSSGIQQAKITSGIIYQQAKEQLEQVEEDIENLRFNLINDQELLTFINSDDLSMRWADYQQITWIVGMNRRVNRNLENIILYNQNGDLIFSLGEVYFERKSDDFGMEITYSQAICHPKTGGIYYEVDIPVMNKNYSEPHLDGTIKLLFNTENVHAIVSGALLNSNSAIALLDDMDQVIVSDGKWRDSYGDKDISISANEKNFLVYDEKIGNTGWRFVSIISKEGLLFGTEQLSWIVYLTFFAVSLAIIFLYISLYQRVIRPIIRQTAFMSNFTSDTRQRMEVIEENELGFMARQMNQMLDDIEELNGKILESKKRYLEIQYEKKRTEMIAYKSQINPHFLYNTFECIRGMALYKGQKDIADITLALSEMFRFSVKGEEIVTVLDSVKNLERYARIVEYRFAGGYRIHIDARRETFNCKIPKLMLQPLLENAVLHGLERKSGEGRVEVLISEKNSRLLVSIEDNGSGIASGELAKIQNSMRIYDEKGTIADDESGIGLLNVYRRMRLFYGDSAELEISSQLQEGTRICLNLPALKEEAYV